jgi:hypothetical protein
MSHLEDLIAEYYDWKGYLIKRNVKVGRLGHGGWEMELDVIAYNPHTEHLIHLEASIDAHSWETREKRFTKKFNSSKKYIFKEVFTWLSHSTKVEEVAVLISHPKDRHELAGARIISIDELMSEIREEVKNCGIVAKSAIPEQYPHLRTLQLALCGYYKVL